MIGRRVIEVDGQLDQPKSQHTGIEVEVSLRVTRNRGDMVDAHGFSGG
jgi:hypothetical protein